MTDAFDAYTPSALPEPVVAYLDARDENRHADASAAFAPDATVLDDGRAYEGGEAIRAWIEESATGGAFTYTSTRLAQRVPDQAHPAVWVRLDGDFPGGTVVLRYAFEVAADLITRLSTTTSPRPTERTGPPAKNAVR